RPRRGSRRRPRPRDGFRGRVGEPTPSGWCTKCMKRLVFTASVAAAFLVPATAAAKGPSEAKISGPGLSSTVTITGNGEGDTATDLGLLVAETGFFPEVYGQSPSPLLRAKPPGLGPRYTVVYTVPGPSTGTLE